MSQADLDILQRRRNLENSILNKEIQKQNNTADFWAGTVQTAGSLLNKTIDTVDDVSTIKAQEKANSIESDFNNAYQKAYSNYLNHGDGATFLNEYDDAYNKIVSQAESELKGLSKIKFRQITDKNKLAIDNDIKTGTSENGKFTKQLRENALSTDLETFSLKYSNNYNFAGDYLEGNYTGSDFGNSFFATNQEINELKQVSMIDEKMKYESPGALLDVISGVVSEQEMASYKEKYKDLDGTDLGLAIYEDLNNTINDTDQYLKSAISWHQDKYYEVYKNQGYSAQQSKDLAMVSVGKASDEINSSYISQQIENNIKNYSKDYDELFVEFDYRQINPVTGQIYGDLAEEYNKIGQSQVNSLKLSIQSDIQELYASSQFNTDLAELNKDGRFDLNDLEYLIEKYGEYGFNPRDMKEFEPIRWGNILRAVELTEQKDVANSLNSADEEYNKQYTDLLQFYQKYQPNSDFLCGENTNNKIRSYIEEKKLDFDLSDFGKVDPISTYEQLSAISTVMEDGMRTDVKRDNWKNSSFLEKSISGSGDYKGALQFAIEEAKNYLSEEQITEALKDCKDDWDRFDAVINLLIDNDFSMIRPEDPLNSIDTFSELRQAFTTMGKMSIYSEVQGKINEYNETVDANMQLDLNKSMENAGLVINGNIAYTFNNGAMVVNKSLPGHEVADRIAEVIVTGRYDIVRQSVEDDLLMSEADKEIFRSLRLQDIGKQGLNIDEQTLGMINEVFAELHITGTRAENELWAYTLSYFQSNPNIEKATLATEIGSKWNESVAKMTASFVLGYKTDNSTDNDDWQITISTFEDGGLEKNEIKYLDESSDWCNDTSKIFIGNLLDDFWNTDRFSKNDLVINALRGDLREYSEEQIRAASIYCALKINNIPISMSLDEFNGKKGDLKDFYTRVGEFMKGKSQTDMKIFMDTASGINQIANASKTINKSGMNVVVNGNKILFDNGSQAIINDGKITYINTVGEPVSMDLESATNTDDSNSLYYKTANNVLDNLLTSNPINVVMNNVKDGYDIVGLTSLATSLEEMLGTFMDNDAVKSVTEFETGNHYQISIKSNSKNYSYESGKVVTKQLSFENPELISPMKESDFNEIKVSGVGVYNFYDDGRIILTLEKQEVDENKIQTPTIGIGLYPVYTATLNKYGANADEGVQRDKETIESNQIVIRGYDITKVPEIDSSKKIDSVKDFRKAEQEYRESPIPLGDIGRIQTGDATKKMATR